MSGLCGFATERRDWIGAHPISEMAAPLRRFDGCRARTANGCLGSVALVGRAQESDIFTDGTDFAAIWGRPTLNDELAPVAERQGAARALAQAYVRTGSEMLGCIGGSFALAISSRSRGEVLIATDRLGTRPMFYYADNDRLLFGTAPASVTAARGMDWHTDPQAIYHYLYFHMVPGPRTVYRNLYRLSPGTCLSWRDGKVDLRQYWGMRFVEDEQRPLAELKDEFIRLLRDSVARVAAGGVTGAFLSGGTDSSTVAGMLGEITGKPANTYSIGFAAEGYDEMRYARIAARHFGTNHHEHYISAQEVVEAIPLVALAHDQPFGNSSAVPTYYCAKLAKDDGIEVLLGGDGGDELFGGNERYAMQYLYSLYSDRSEVLRKNVIEPILFRAPAALPLVGKAQRYVRHASQPMPARYDNYNLVEHFGADVMLTADFLASIDPDAPAAETSEAYWNQHAATLINRMLGFDLRYTLTDNDLPKVMRSCELAGVAAGFPMLDDRLVAFSASLAPDLKLRRGRLRFFFKEALRGFLPDEIIAKTKHGFGLPFGPWLMAHERLREIAFDSLAALKRRNIVKSSFIDELCSRHVTVHAKYYGTMVWVLMMLEQWFERSVNAANVPTEPVTEGAM